MTTSTNPAGSTPEKWLRYLADNRKVTAYVLFGISLLCVVLAFVAYRQINDYLAVCLGAVLLAAVALVGAVWQIAQETSGPPSVDATRILVLLVGGLLGVIVALTAVAQGWHWRDIFLGGIEKWQGPERWKIWASVAGLLAGLALAFFSLLLAQTQVRANAMLRRLLYGYNAVLTGLLLLAVLLTAHLLLFVLQERGTVLASYDCTHSSLYTLSPRTKNLLEKLDRPVTVYVIWPVQEGALREIQTLLDNCRAITNKLNVQYVSSEDPRVYQLRERYQFTDRLGLLVVYGEGDTSISDFITVNEIFPPDPRQDMRGGTTRSLFKGEDALLTRLSALTEDKPPSRRIVELLKKPGRAVAIFSDTDPLLPRVRALLDAQHVGNDKLVVEFRSPEKNRKEVDDLKKRYDIKEASGVLFVPKDSQAGKAEFIPPGQLFQKWVVYFTQGNGELDINDTGAMDREQRMDLDHGLGLLKRRLEEGAYEVRGLQLTSVEDRKSSDARTEVSTKVPADAVAVVVARPRTPLPDFAVTALRDYMNPTDKTKPKGKLIVLLDVVPSADRSKMQRTGLEDLLASFGVVVGDAQVMSFSTRPQIVPILRNEGSRNPIAPLFADGMQLFQVRQLSIAQPPPTDRVVDILAGIPPRGAWLVKDPRQTDFDRELALAGRTTDITPVAVAVSDRTIDKAGTQTDEPRLVVFGDATFVSNAYLSNNAVGPICYDLFYSTVSWLRGRPGDIGIAPKQREYFVLSPKASAWKLLWTPALLLLVGIVGLGTGVWVVRRR